MSKPALVVDGKVVAYELLSLVLTILGIVVTILAAYINHTKK